VTLVAAGVCPHAPLLVPELGVGLGPDIDVVRARCAETVAALRSGDADRLFVVGADIGPRATTFRPWGVDVPVDVPEPMPLSLLVGGWLTRGRPRSFVVVDPATEPADCAELGADLAAAADRVALLVMGDGSARHDEKAPGYIDERAAPYDEAVHQALAKADVDALLALDPTLADDLLCAGRAPWQVLAGAGQQMANHGVSASLFVRFGVGYHVAHWEVTGRN